MSSEIIGILGTLCILSAFSMNGEFHIRVLDTVGAVLFILYGFCIGSFSTVLLNTALVIIQIYKLRKLRKES